MAARPSTEGRTGLIPVRLSEIPIAVRRSAAAPLLRIFEESGDAWAAIQLTRAIETPSKAVRWIPRAAYNEARKRKRWA
jgi:hypothetical protein